jgi:hypothetical protein
MPPKSALPRTACARPCIRPTSSRRSALSCGHARRFFLSRGVRLFSFLQPPDNAQRVIAFRRDDQSALFKRLDGVAGCGQRAYEFLLLRLPQQHIAAERIGFQIVAILQMRQQVLFGLAQIGRRCWRGIFAGCCRNGPCPLARAMTSVFSCALLRHAFTFRGAFLPPPPTSQPSAQLS